MFWFVFHPVYISFLSDKAMNIFKNVGFFRGEGGGGMCKVSPCASKVTTALKL